MINLFNTPVKIISIPNFQELNKKIGEGMSLGFKKNFNDGLPKDEADQLAKIFTDEIKLYLKEITNKKIEIELVKSWVSFTDKYGFNTPHDHSDNIVIGVYYINVPEFSGDLLLHDPRGAHSFISQFELNASGQLVSGRSYYRVKPKTGSLVLFPSYIVHSVEPNMSDETRRSLAINFRYKNFNQFK